MKSPFRPRVSVRPNWQGKWDVVHSTPFRDGLWRIRWVVFWLFVGEKMQKANPALWIEDYPELEDGLR